MEPDTTSEKIGHKVRQHLWQQKMPFVCVVGDRELESGGLTVRHRVDGDVGQMRPEEFGELLDRMMVDRR